MNINVGFNGFSGAFESLGGCAAPVLF